MRCKVLINFSALENHKKALELLIFKNKGLIHLSPNENEIFAYFQNYKLTNYFLEDLFEYMVHNGLYLSITNKKPYDFHPENHIKKLYVNAVENPVSLKTGPEFTIVFYVDKECSGYATYLIKKNGAICPPYQTLREYGYVEQSFYFREVTDVLRILKFLKAKLGKKIIFVSVDYQ